MPAPKRPNTGKATEMATAKRVRAGQETMAARLRAAGWVCIPPEEIPDQTRTLAEPS
jgi:hypothetical protein